MTREEMRAFMEETIFPELMQVRKDGQREYAGGIDAFGNFNRLSQELDVDRKKILWVYAMKHKDGIASYLNGNTEQRDSVQGRIKDLIMYLMLLWGMTEEELAAIGRVGVPDMDGPLLSLTFGP